MSRPVSIVIPPPRRADLTAARLASPERLRATARLGAIPSRHRGAVAV
ncbi:MAG: hypothetical protein IT200_09620 [Thermoleophilia bacterium]|nr:hypothetical protein [Thermoleophilia bacterium]